MPAGGVAISATLVGISKVPAGDPIMWPVGETVSPESRGASPHLILIDETPAELEGEDWWSSSNEVGEGTFTLRDIRANESSQGPDLLVEFDMDFPDSGRAVGTIWLEDCP